MPISSVLIAVVVLVLAAGVMWTVVRRRRHGQWDHSLEQVTGNAALLEAEFAPDAAAGLVREPAKWTDQRGAVTALEAELTGLRTVAPDAARRARAIQVETAVTRWRATMDAQSHPRAEPGSNNLAAVAAELRAALGRQP